MNGTQRYFTLRALFFAAAVAVVALAVTYYWRQRDLEQQCAYNLAQIYGALEMYEINHGVLPNLAFYPDNPKHAPDSLLVVLDPYAFGSDLGYCPSSHPLIRDRGLSYVWNIRMNGKKLHAAPDAPWLITEISALSDQVRPPHRGQYLILYADGRIARSRTPPPGLSDLWPTTVDGRQQGTEK